MVLGKFFFREKRFFLFFLRQLQNFCVQKLKIHDEYLSGWAQNAGFSRNFYQKGLFLLTGRNFVQEGLFPKWGCFGGLRFWTCKVTFFSDGTVKINNKSPLATQLFLRFSKSFCPEAQKPSIFRQKPLPMCFQRRLKFDGPPKISSWVTFFHKMTSLDPTFSTQNDPTPWALSRGR